VTAAATAGNVVEVERLSVRFGDTPVLTDLSFRVERGTSLAILGPNGAGKTASGSQWRSACIRSSAL
jgi:ABC-type branched-subunit amino acid transport system ATPase component